MKTFALKNWIQREGKKITFLSFIFVFPLEEARMVHKKFFKLEAANQNESIIMHLIRLDAFNTDCVDLLSQRI